MIEGGFYFMFKKILLHKRNISFCKIIGIYYFRNKETSLSEKTKITTMYGHTEILRGLSPNKIWFTSDTHFFHKRILEYCQRPFANVEEMNNELIYRWNQVVRNDDVVFHLGDFCLGKPNKWNSILDRLNGKICLILGNHDTIHLNENVAQRFERVAFQMLLNVNGQKIYLNHFPFLSYTGETDYTWQLFGHIHSYQQGSQLIDNQRLTLLRPNQYDVGVDNNNFTPISYQQIEEIMKKRMQEHRHFHSKK